MVAPSAVTVRSCVSISAREKDVSDSVVAGSANATPVGATIAPAKATTAKAAKVPVRFLRAVRRRGRFTDGGATTAEAPLKPAESSSLPEVTIYPVYPG